MLDAFECMFAPSKWRLCYRPTGAAAVIHRLQGTVLTCHLCASAEFDARPLPLLRQMQVCATNACRKRVAAIQQLQCCDTAPSALTLQQLLCKRRITAFTVL